MRRSQVSMIALGFLGVIAACPGPGTREDTGSPAPVDAGATDRVVADQGSHPDQDGLDTAVPVDASAAGDTTGLDNVQPDRAGTDLTSGVDTSPAPDAATGPDTFDAGPECSTDDAGPSCTHPLSCCSEHCVNVLQHPAHCGACDLACGAGAYCADTPGCSDLDFGTLCDNDVRHSVSTGATDDNIALVATANAVAAHCSTTVSHATLSTASLVDQTTYAPLVGVGHLLILHGGPYYQLMTRYFEESGGAPLRYAYDGTGNRNRFVKTDGSGFALDVLASLTTPSHDYFLVELFPDPTRGALILASYGFDVAGSRAAGWYLIHHLLAAPAPLASWYVVEWTDLDDDLIPSSLDEFALLSSSAS